MMKTQGEIAKSTVVSVEEMANSFNNNQTIVNTEREIMDPKEAIYERMIIIVPYKAPEMVK